MKYWLHPRRGEWGILRENSDIQRAAWRTDEDLLVMERPAFVSLYECLERLSLAPTYSSVLPTPLN
jgi:hypothetical protein